MRLRSNLCLWTAPPPYSGRGRPRKHGQKFKLNDPQTWGEADQELEVGDPKLGLLRIRLWSNLHFRGAASHPMQLLRVERLEAALLASSQTLVVSLDWREDATFE